MPLRVTEVSKITKADFYRMSQTGFKFKKRYYRCKSKAGVFANTLGEKINKQQCNFHSWKIIPNVLLKDVGGVSLFHSNLALSDA